MALLSRAVWSVLNLPHCSISTLSSKNVKLVLTKPIESGLTSFKGRRKCHGEGDFQRSNVTHISSKRISFDGMIEIRRGEARRSIVVQVQSGQSASELNSFCSRYGTVKSMHHYSLPGPSHYILVEFNQETDIDNVLRYSGHLDTTQTVPVRSPFLWFRIGKSKNKTNSGTMSNVYANKEENARLSSKELYSKMCEADSVSDQILLLHEATKLGDIGSRLRFLTAFQMEQALSGPFPSILAHPFGSTVNGFGKMNCDLDLVLDANRDEAKPDCRLIFHAKNLMSNGRTQVQRHMEVIGDMCQLFLPGCANVRRILHARVPIVKYRQELTGVECDLSMTNMSGVYMSELLFVLGEVDERVRPLVRAVRTWARDVGLTNPSPGRWITNFSLTLLVLFYLQQTNPPVLPTLDQMIRMATASDKRVTAEGVNCTFIRDIDKLCGFMKKQKRNENSLEELLLKFFEFYCAFDFSSHAISLGSGSAVPKPEHSAIYISNPLERGLNVSKNISPDEMERLRIELRNASWVLEANLKQPVDQSLWGFAAICQASKLQAKGKNIFYIRPKPVDKFRTFDVTELFEDDLNITVNEKSHIGRNLSESGAKSLNGPLESRGIINKLLQKPPLHTSRRKKR